MMKNLIYAFFLVIVLSSCECDEPGQSEPLDIEMVLVEGGEYDKSAYPDKYPEAESEKVQLNSYHIGKYEVTQAQWEAVMGYNPSGIIGASLPVNNVSWSDVRVFIKRLNSLTGKTYRLPSVAEWEFAARGGNQSKKFRYSGSDNALDVAWCSENSGYLIHPVGSKQPNELGIYDMCGNVWEWCFPIFTDLQEWFLIHLRVIKGISSYNSADDLSLNRIDWGISTSKSEHAGFRIVLDSDQNSQNDDVRVLTGDAEILGDRIFFYGTINNVDYASVFGLMIGVDVNSMNKYESSGVIGQKFSHSVLNKYSENSVIYYCAYAIDGWDLVKGEIKTFNTGK